METRVSSVNGGGFAPRDSLVSVGEVEGKEGAPSLPLFSPSSLEFPPANSFEKLSYTLSGVSAFLDPKSLGRFSCASKKVNERGTSSNKLWKPFLNPIAQSQVDESEAGSARQFFQRPEHRDVKYLTCDQAGQVYLRQLQTEIRDHMSLSFFFQKCVWQRALTNELMEVAKMIRHVPTEQQAILNVPGILNLIHRDCLSAQAALALTPAQLEVLSHDGVSELICAGALTLKRAFELTSAQCEILSNSGARELIVKGVLMLESAFELTPPQLKVLSECGVCELIVKGVLTLERALELTSAQVEALSHYVVRKGIVQGVLTLERAFELTSEQLTVLRNYRLYTFLDKGMFTLESALESELTSEELEILRQLGVPR